MPSHSHSAINRKFGIASIVFLWLVLMALLVFGVRGLERDMLAKSAVRANDYTSDLAQFIAGIFQQELNLHMELLSSVNDAAEGRLEEAAHIIPLLKNDEADYHWIALTDTSGRVLAFTQEFPRQNITISDQQYFHQLVRPDTPDKVLGEPMDARDNNSGLIIARRLEFADGTLNGFLVASLNLGGMERFLGKLSLTSDDAILLVRRDGLICFWHGPGRVVLSTFSTALARVIKETEPETFLVSTLPIDGKPRLGRFVSVGDNLLLYVGRTFDDAHQLYGHVKQRLERWAIIVAVGVSLLGGLAVFWLWPRRAGSGAAPHPSFPFRQQYSSSILAPEGFQQVLAHISAFGAAAQPCALILISCNNYKSIAPEELKRLAEGAGRILRENIRPMDSVGLLDESFFALLMPVTPPDTAAYTAQVLQSHLSDWIAGAGYAIDISMSVACFSHAVPPSEMLGAARGLLEEAQSVKSDYIIQRSFP